MTLNSVKLNDLAAGYRGIITMIGDLMRRFNSHLEKPFDEVSANALLTSDIFGFKSIFARGATPDTIEPFDDYKDIKEMNELEKRLELKQGFKDLNIKIG